MRILCDLPGRGPKAFEMFFVSLRETNHDHIANKLLGLPGKCDHCLHFISFYFILFYLQMFHPPIQYQLFQINLE